MRNIFKKAIIFLLMIVMSLTCISCKSPEGNSGNENNPNNSASQFENTDFVFTDNGVSEYSIVISNNASLAVKNAASELQKYVEKASDVKLPIITDDGLEFAEESKYISLGNTSIFATTGINLAGIDFNRDGYKIKTYKKSVFINSENDLGILYGCYGFLTIQYNFEAFAGDSIYIDDAKTSKTFLKNIDFLDVPDFRGRNTDGRFTYEPYSASILRYNSVNSEIYDNGAGRDWVPGSSHTFKKVLPEAIYNNPDLPETYHPEWYEKSGNQICLTAAGVVEETVARAIYFLTENPTASIFNMSCEDFDGYCKCTTCKAETSKYKISGYIIRFMNKVIEGVEEWRAQECPERDIRYATFSYGTGVAAPTVKKGGGEYAPIDNTVVPHPRLYIYLTFMNACYNHALDDEKCSVNYSAYANLKAWGSICNHFCMYDYNANFSEYLPYFNDISMLKNKLSIYKDMGIDYVASQNTTSSNLKSMGVLQGYITAKLMWDTSLDVNELINNFMKHYYKDAAPYMEKYYEYLRTYLYVEDAKARTDGYDGVHLGIYAGYYRKGSTYDIWSKNFAEKASEYLEDAMNAAQNSANVDDRSVLTTRILEERVCLRYVIVKRYNQFYDVDTSVYLDYLNNWEKDAMRVGAKSTSEHVGIRDFVAQLRKNAI